LEVLRQSRKDKVVTTSQASGTLTFLANLVLISGAILLFIMPPLRTLNWERAGEKKQVT